MVGPDGRPTQKSLRQMLSRVDRVPPGRRWRAAPHRLDKVLDRIHILEGRQLVLLNIDEVIRIIREPTSPSRR
jgi:topoisomerase-4 subunit A